MNNKKIITTAIFPLLEPATSYQCVVNPKSNQQLCNISTDEPPSIKTFADLNQLQVPIQSQNYLTASATVSIHQGSFMEF